MLNCITLFSEPVDIGIIIHGLNQIQIAHRRIHDSFMNNNFRNTIKYMRSKFEPGNYCTETDDNIVIDVLMDNATNSDFVNLINDRL